MSNKVSHIHVRIDPNTKHKAQQALAELGLDLSSSIKLFLHNVIITQSIPLELRTRNGFTLQEESRMIKESIVAQKSGKVYQTPEQLHAELLAENNVPDDHEV